MLFRLLIGKLRILHTALSAADLNMTAIHVACGIRSQKHQYLSQVLRRTEAAARDVCQQRITVLLNALRSDLCCDHARHIGHSTRILAAANSAAMDALRFFTAAFAALYVARQGLLDSAVESIFDMCVEIITGHIRRSPLKQIIYKQLDRFISLLIRTLID